LSGQSAEAGTAALFTHEGYRYTVVTIASGLHGVEAGLWYVPPGDDTNTPAWNYFGRRTDACVARHEHHLPASAPGTIHRIHRGVGFRPYGPPSPRIWPSLTRGRLLPFGPLPGVAAGQPVAYRLRTLNTG